MRKRGLFLVLFVVLVFSSNAMAVPYAPLLPLNAQGKKVLALKKMTPAQREAYAPQAGIFEIAPYPGSLLSISSKNKDGRTSMIKLVSRDDAGKVIAWYRAALNGKGWKSAPALIVKQMDEVAVFAQTDKARITAFDAMNLRTIRISKVNDPKTDLGLEAMVNDVSGIRSAITIQIIPLM